MEALKVEYNENQGGGESARWLLLYCSYEYRTLAIEVCFLIVPCLFVNIFPFPPSTDKLLGDVCVVRRCASNRYIYIIMRQYY